MMFLEIYTAILLTICVAFILSGVYLAYIRTAKKIEKEDEYKNTVYKHLQKIMEFELEQFSKMAFDEKQQYLQRVKHNRQTMNFDEAYSELHKETLTKISEEFEKKLYDVIYHEIDTHIARAMFDKLITDKK